VKANKKLRRLLVITNRLPLNSTDQASPFVVDFLHALQDTGLEVEAFTPHIGEDAGDLGLPVHRFKWGEAERTLSELNLLRPASWQKIRRYFRAGRDALCRHLADNQYDHLLALWALPSGWLAQQAQAKFGIDYSIWALGSDINVWAHRPLTGKLIRGALAGATNLFADGHELAAKVTALTKRECHFLPSFRRLGCEKQPGTRQHLFLYLGRLERSKGIFDLLRAFAAINVDISDYRLLFLGDGSQRSRLQRAIRRLKLQGKVHVLGYVPCEEIVEYLQKARALVIPTHSDSIPLVFGEALQTATPLIVTEIGDLGNLVREHGLGLSVQPNSVSQLRDALVKMMLQEYNIAAPAAELVRQLSPEAAVARFLEVTNAD
jgi:glycosyltransferase involved in cell wall biosynthesis